MLCDHYTGVREAVEDLLDRGHERIALVTGHRHVRPVRERVRGLTDAMAARRIPVDDRLVVLGSFTSEFARQHVLELLDGPDAPTAFLTGGLQVTLGCLLAFAERDLRPGLDIGLVALDEIEMLDVFRPTISVVARYPQQMGAQAAQLFLERHAGGPTRTVVLPTRLSRRQFERAAGARRCARRPPVNGTIAPLHAQITDAVLSGRVGCPENLAVLCADHLACRGRTELSGGWRDDGLAGAVAEAAMRGHHGDLDDIHWPTLTHPGSVVWPVVLGIAAVAPTPGVEVARAASAGYDMTAAVADVIAASGVTGIHRTSVAGHAGAAIAAALLLGDGGGAPTPSGWPSRWRAASARRSTNAPRPVASTAPRRRSPASMRRARHDRE